MTDDNDGIKTDPVVDQLLQAICDGRPINWNMVESMLDSEKHVLLPHLKLLEHVMQFHMNELDEDNDEEITKMS